MLKQLSTVSESKMKWSCVCISVSFWFCVSNAIDYIAKTKGDTVEFKCKLPERGSATEMKWFMDRETVIGTVSNDKVENRHPYYNVGRDVDTEGSYLRINNAAVSDSGNYSCKSDVPIGGLRLLEKYVLYVKEDDRLQCSYQMQEDMKTVEIGDIIQLQCKYEYAGLEEADVSVRWLETQSSILREDDTISTSIDEAITESHLNTSFTCNLTYRGLDFDSCQVIPYSGKPVIEPPVVTVSDGNNATFTCYSRQNPTWDVDSLREFEGRHTITKSEGSIVLHLQNLTLNDSYTTVRCSTDPNNRGLDLFYEIGRLFVQPVHPKTTMRSSTKDKTQASGSAVISVIYIVIIFAIVLVLAVLVFLYKRRSVSSQSSLSEAAKSNERNGHDHTRVAPEGSDHRSEQSESGPMYAKVNRTSKRNRDCSPGSNSQCEKTIQEYQEVNPLGNYLKKADEGYSGELQRQSNQNPNFQCQKTIQEYQEVARHDSKPAASGKQKDEELYENSGELNAGNGAIAESEEETMRNSENNSAPSGTAGIVYADLDIEAIQASLNRGPEQEPTVYADVKH